MIKIGFWDRVINRNREIVIFDDTSLYDSSKNTALKRVAIESVIGMISRTIIQSEFRIKKNGKYIKDNAYYKFNVKPNKNQSASSFWSEVIFKLIYDGECLIVKSRDDDLLIADDYDKKEYAVFGDTFSNVLVKGLELDGVFKRNDVVYFEYGNEDLSKLVDSLFYDYGELFSRLIEQQMRKGQLRASIDIDAQFSKGEESQKRIQTFIDKTYSAIKDKSVALFPQQKGLEYNEHSKQNTTGASVDEVDKVADGFLKLVANAVGMPVSLLKGDMADIENITRNYMKFCIDPIICIMSDEMNAQFIDEADYLKGDSINIKRISYRDMFDNAVAVDKLRSSSVVEGNELRDELGLEYSDDPIHDHFIMTKNYEYASKGGENEDE